MSLLVGSLLPRREEWDFVSVSLPVMVPQTLLPCLHVSIGNGYFWFC